MNREEHDRDLLAQLAAHPGWSLWQRYIAEKRQEYYVRLAAVLLHSPKPVDQRSIDYKRGYWDAARHLLDHPTKVLEEIKLERDS